MNREAKSLLTAALQLSPEDRTVMASRLLDSLDEGQDEDAAAAWDEEIARRVKQIDSGQVQGIPLAEVRRRVAESDRE